MHACMYVCIRVCVYAFLKREKKHVDSTKELSGETGDGTNMKPIKKLQQSVRRSNCAEWEGNRGLEIRVAFLHD